jgi:hypothetical protein
MSDIYRGEVYDRWLRTQRRITIGVRLGIYFKMAINSMGWWYRRKKIYESATEMSELMSSLDPLDYNTTTLCSEFMYLYLMKATMGGNIGNMDIGYECFEQDFYYLYLKKVNEVMGGFRILNHGGRFMCMETIETVWRNLHLNKKNIEYFHLLDGIYNTKNVLFYTMWCQYAIKEDYDWTEMRKILHYDRYLSEAIRTDVYLDCIDMGLWYSRERLICAYYIDGVNCITDYNGNTIYWKDCYRMHLYTAELRIAMQKELQISDTMHRGAIVYCVCGA